MVVISNVCKNSIAERHHISSGEKLVRINGNEIKDVLDYRFYITEKNITLEIEDLSGKVREVIISKPRYDDIGLEFETFLMDKKRTCSNKCIFCFVDQNPKGMRETVYFKDDDTRLSFLMGNYVTLTNVSDEELKRIVKMRLSPVNISVHTTNPELRRKMLNNRFAGNILSQMKILFDGEIKMNVQIVLVRSVNDKAELERTFRDLEKFFPWVQSIAVVPCGITKHRENLCPITPFDASSAADVLEIIERYQKEYLKRFSSRFVFASDEFYLLAKKALPQDEEYEGYMQLDNGVGLIKNAENEILDELDAIEKFGELPDYSKRKAKIVLATGVSAGDFLDRICKKISEKLPNLTLSVKVVKNNFFGENVTVAGLLTGSDYVSALKDVRNEAECVIIPAVSLRAERDLFLDGMSVPELEEKIGVPVFPTENGAAIFDTLKKIIDR